MMKKKNLFWLILVSLNLAFVFVSTAQTYYDEFESGKIESPWKPEGSDTGIKNEMSLSGNYAFKAYMTPKLYTNARSELKFTGKNGLPFFQELLTTYGIGVAIYFPNDFEPDNTSSEIILQYHGKQDSHDTYTNPPFAVYLQGNELRVTTRWIKRDPGTNNDKVTNNYPNLAKVQPGKWHFFVVDINWDYRATGNGFAKVYMKIGSEPTKSDIILHHDGPIGSQDQEGPYFKMGIYKWDWKKQAKVDQSKAAGVTHRTLYFDNFLIKEGGILEGQSTSNAPPVVDAGKDKTITLPANSVILNGTATDDNSVSSVRWTKTSGGVATIVSNSQLNTEIRDLEEGNYTFRLTATDNEGATASDEVKVSVVKNNSAPVVSAGNSYTLTLPENSVTVTGTASDSDGSISSVNWSRSSGGSATIVSPDTYSTEIKDLQEGETVFRFSATDNDGGTSSDFMKVTVYPAPINAKPVVNAGNDKNITLPVNTVTLNGLASDPDGSINKVEWTKVTGGNATIVSADQYNTDVTDLVEGTYTFTFTAWDNQGAESSDNVIVTVLAEPANQRPVVAAGADKQITLPTNSVTVNGTASDPDGSIIEVTWTKINGGSASIVNANALSTQITNLSEGTYTFRLTARDDDGQTSSDNMVVTVLPEPPNVLPVVDAGTDQQIQLPANSVQVAATASDPDGTIASVQWTKVNGGTATIVDPAQLATVINGLVEGTYTFRLTATDNKGESASDELTITVLAEAANMAPLVDAGSNQQIQLPVNSAQVAATATDPDGTIASVQWTKVNGGAGTIDNPTQLATAISGLVEGTYTFRLTATDNEGETASDELTITVLAEAANLPPVVDAGNDQQIQLPENTVQVAASASDSDGSITDIQWTQTNGTVANIVNPGQLVTEINGLIEGIYSFRITATDNKGETASDELTITVLAEAANLPPVVDAGKDQTITLPENSTQVIGTATDNDGSIVSVTWTKIDGGTAQIQNPNAYSTQITGLEEGAYSFRFTATDNDGEVVSDRIDIDVLPAPSVPNQKPVVDAGSDQTIYFPANSVELIGSATDPDGSIAAVVWTEVSGADVTIIDENSLNARAENLVSGEYFFRLTATDNEGLSSSAEIMVTVVGENQAPVVELSNSINVSLPVESYELSAMASDPDGQIVSYEWIQEKGPQLLLSQDRTATLRLEEIEVGNYTFRVIVTDDRGATAEAVTRVKATLDMNKVAGVPRVFSPDGNGIDDYWIFEDTSIIEGCNLIIFNRQGRKVYETASYANDWDGTYNGNPLPDGDYYYVIQCDDGGDPLTGGVRIIRQ